jgi:hypothetical protein
MAETTRLTLMRIRIIINLFLSAAAACSESAESVLASVDAPTRPGNDFASLSATLTLKRAGPAEADTGAASEVVRRKLLCDIFNKADRTL